MFDVNALSGISELSFDSTFPSPLLFFCLVLLLFLSLKVKPCRSVKHLYSHARMRARAHTRTHTHISTNLTATWFGRHNKELFIPYPTYKQ